TARFLTSQELVDLWTAVRSTPCYREYPGAHRNWADLLAGIALRDTAEIARAAEELRPETLNNEERTFVTLAAAAVALNSGASKEATQVLAEIWNQNQYPRFYELSLRQLFTMSRLTRDKTEDDTLALPLVELAR